MVDKSEDNEIGDSFKNVLNCPICFNNTNDPNIIMEICGCGHIFCKNCLDYIEKNKKLSKCPTCKRDINVNERRKIYI